MNDVDNFSIQSDVTKMAKAIKEVIEVCKSNGITCWLNYGALLGMIRDKKLLHWNNDAELCCWYEEGISQKIELIVNELNRAGYASYYYSSIGAISIKNEGVIVNVNCLWKENENVIRPHETAAQKGYASSLSRVFYWAGTLACSYPSGLISYKNQKNKFKSIIKSIVVSFFRIFPKIFRKKFFLLMIVISEFFGGKYMKTEMPFKYFKELRKIDFYGSEVFIPKSSEELLEYIYGNEWKIPKENWSFYNKENQKHTGISFKSEKWKYENMDLA